MLGATDLSRREGEVCSRISMAFVLRDRAGSGIGKESVMTYRKRAYHRLGIGSQRELLMWYLALWTALRGNAAGAMVGETHLGTPLGASYRRPAHRPRCWRQLDLRRYRQGRESSDASRTRARLDARATLRRRPSCFSHC